MKKIFLATISVALLFTVQSTVATPTNLVDNGDFEAPVVTAGPGWDIYDSGYTDLGWTVEWYDGSTSYGGWTRPTTAKLELHRGVLGNAYNGEQYAEMDTDWNGHVGSLNNEPASVKIYQNIPTCEYGGYYTLSYAWSPRPGYAYNGLEVYWDGNLVATHSGSGPSSIVWKKEIYSDLIGIGGSTELAFIETGRQDSYGMFLDSVSVVLQEGGCGPGAIAIDKTANPIEIYPGETVNYTYTVTNADSFPLSNVTVTDNKCSPVTGPTGDDSDNVLENGEAWIYTCSTSLSETTLNTATASGVDPFQNTVTDTATTTVAVKGIGCTLTQGYWKTHSSYGPAAYDDTWANIEDTQFFSSGQTYYEVLWTAPKKGNAYYILAHQYIAAELNYMPADVLATWNEAKSLFETYTPGEIAALKGKNALRKNFIELAEILDDYNNGEMSVPHCSEL